MAGRFSRKKRTGGTSWLLGLVLMLLLVGAIVLGASWVLRAAKSVGAQDAQKEPETAQQAAPEAPAARRQCVFPRPRRSCKPTAAGCANRRNVNI